MKNINIEDIIKICNGKMISKGKNIQVSDFSKDTRSIKKGEFYLAIKGETSNGNKYVKDALEKGAIGCLIDEEIEQEIINKYEDRAIIKVENTIKALQELAKYKRSLYNIPVVAVTGSVRKNKYKGCYCKCGISKI